MRGSTDLNTILQTTVQELAKVLGTSRTFVQLGTDSQSVDGEGEGDQLNGHQESR
jgi:hypothetical protein